MRSFHCVWFLIVLELFEKSWDIGLQPSEFPKYNRFIRTDSRHLGLHETVEWVRPAFHNWQRAISLPLLAVQDGPDLPPDLALCTADRRASQGALVVKNPPVYAGDLRERVHFLGREDPLEEEMTTHSSVLALRILWTEEPGGLQSTGLQRVRHN